MFAIAGCAMTGHARETTVMHHGQAIAHCHVVEQAVALMMKLQGGSKVRRSVLGSKDANRAIGRAPATWNCSGSDRDCAELQFGPCLAGHWESAITFACLSSVGCAHQ